MWPAGDGVWECGGDEAPFFFHIVAFQSLVMALKAVDYPHLNLIITICKFI